MHTGTMNTEDVVTRDWPFGESAHFRLLLKQSVLEFYLDDVYVQSYSLHHAATGRIGVFGHGSDITDMRAWKAVV